MHTCLDSGPFFFFFLRRCLPLSRGKEVAGGVKRDGDVRVLERG